MITITVLETVAVFDGPDTIYRYDIPADGISDGWAVDAVLGQLDEFDPEHTTPIVIDADPPVRDALSRAVLAAGWSLDQPPTPEPEEEEPVAPGRHRKQDSSRPWLPAAVFAGIVVVITATWLLLRPGGDDPEPVVAAPTTSTKTSTSTPTPTPSSTTQQPPEPEVQYHDIDQFQVAAPPGTTGIVEGERLTITGADPDLRIYVTVDPLDGMTPLGVMEAVDRELENDPQQTITGRTVDTRQWTERPGDGSLARWYTFIIDDDQISIGCHTRTNPTAEQARTCDDMREGVSVRNNSALQGT